MSVCQLVPVSAPNSTVSDPCLSLPVPISVPLSARASCCPISCPVPLGPQPAPQSPCLSREAFLALPLELLSGTAGAPARLPDAWLSLSPASVCPPSTSTSHALGHFRFCLFLGLFLLTSLSSPIPVLVALCSPTSSLPPSLSLPLPLLPSLLPSYFLLSFSSFPPTCLRTQVSLPAALLSPGPQLWAQTYKASHQCSQPS